MAALARKAGLPEKSVAGTAKKQYGGKAQKALCAPFDTPREKARGGVILDLMV